MITPGEAPLREKRGNERDAYAKDRIQLRSHSAGEEGGQAYPHRIDRLNEEETVIVSFLLPLNLGRRRGGAGAPARGGHTLTAFRSSESVCIAHRFVVVDALIRRRVRESMCRR